MIRNCSECDVEFDDHSPEKRRIGGLIIHCPECSEEVESRVVGVASGDGKQASLSILKFRDETSRQKYIRFWKQTSGFNKGKSCQIGRGLMSDPAIAFEIVAVEESRNHKGKL